ncbi:hypothetical protein Curi_c14790 [Gottschalkia acidurici 9a]|uniref:Uncharacterized protein n=1 Tax=Gottschalkia acidurici (strain ATCC 7906 / DSM 604 / BCRC 14475 / CIP 104303 / KCTC 5404 / NCIMB 10678 / 9a) TaxID=1128398 RepID=K0AZ04_GOTA9|nr:hypothetical protein Curi_c14790 [Gottschalkia acidurici 9a]
MMEVTSGFSINKVNIISVIYIFCNDIRSHAHLLFFYRGIRNHVHALFFFHYTRNRTHALFYHYDYNGYGKEIYFL